VPFGRDGHPKPLPGQGCLDRQWLQGVPLRLANTEPEENTNPDRYPEAFRLDPAEVNNFIVVPTIPPLRKSAAG
jgi:hypothetical protein